MKRWMTIAVAVAVAGWAGQAQAQQELVINSFGGTYEEEHRRLVIDSFEREHGVTVRVVTAYSADTLAQLRAQKENPQFDVVHFSGGLEAIAASEGLLAPISPDQLGNYDEMYPYAVADIEDGRGPIYTIAVIGLLYDTEQVSSPPTSWTDLQNPDYSGHIVLTDAATNTYGTLGLLMMNQVAGGTLDDIQPGLDFVGSILEGSTIVTRSPDIQQAFAQGEAWIAPYAQDYAFTLTKAGLPVRFVQPEEGAAYAPVTVNLVAGRPNTELALKFIDWSIRAEASAGWAEALRYSPTNRTVELSPEVAAEVVYGEEQAAGLVAFDPLAMGEKRPGWNDAWNRLIAQ